MNNHLIQPERPSNSLNFGNPIVFLIVAILAFLGPNGLYLYFAITQPELNQAAIRNPIALAFMIEAMMLLVLFLWQVYRITRSWMQVGLYLILSFIGSLAFSFPFFVYRQKKHAAAPSI
ncbi:MAG: hypothetical protein AAGJ81_15640 [Verrucomicrobiota bacterium]